MIGLGKKARMDQLFLNLVGFPVLKASFSRNRKSPGWSIEILCAESPQLDYHGWPEDRSENEMDWLAGLELFLYAQMLPLPANSPDELLGQTYSFPQSPDDEPAVWDLGVGWLFFCLYTWEHDLVYPTTVTFTKRQEDRYRVKIIGSYRVGEGHYDLQVETWLDWLNE